MSSDAMIAVRFKDVDHESRIKEDLETRCAALVAEFPETVRIELTLSRNHLVIDAHAHATGKSTNSAAHASAPEAKLAGDAALEKLERELRKHHDKMIFAHRREAQKNSGKRT